MPPADENQAAAAQGLDPLEEMMKFADDAANADGSFDLARQSSIYHAKSMVMSIADEEGQKKNLIEEQKTAITEKLEQVFAM